MQEYFQDEEFDYLKAKPNLPTSWETAENYIAEIQAGYELSFVRTLHSCLQAGEQVHQVFGHTFHSFFDLCNAS